MRTRYAVSNVRPGVAQSRQLALWSCGGAELMIVAGAIRAGAGPLFAARPKSKEGVSVLQVKTRRRPYKTRHFGKPRNRSFSGVFPGHDPSRKPRERRPDGKARRPFCGW